MTSQFTGTNPCDLLDNGNCSHLCLISGTNSSGYSCACPDSLVLDENKRDCIGKRYYGCTFKYYYMLFLYTDPPFILISDNLYLWRMNIDGSAYTRLLTYNYIHGLDFDYKLVVHFQTTAIYLFKCFRRDFIFWSDQTNDRIIRSHLNGTGVVVLATGEMSCVCECVEY